MLPATMPPAFSISALIALSEPPVEMTSSTISTRLPFISAASSLPR